MNPGWFERYEEQIHELCLERQDFYRELLDAAMDLVFRCYAAELEAWVDMDPEEFLGR